MSVRLGLAVLLLAAATSAASGDPAQPAPSSTPPSAPAEIDVIPPDVPPPPPAPLDIAEPNIFADEATSEVTPAPPHVAPDSPLVRAAKANSTRKKSSRKVITNADVKRSKAKLIVIGSKTKTPAVPAPKSSLQQQDDRLRARDAADAKVAAAEKRVADLEKEMHLVEQAFYDENDVAYRDEVIRKRFEQARRQVDDARKALADARDERERAGGP